MIVLTVMRNDASTARRLCCFRQFVWVVVKTAAFLLLVNDY